MSGSARRRAFARFVKADRRTAAALLAAIAAVFLTGCEEAGQKGAREALQAHLRTLPADGGYRISDVHCTQGGRIAYFQSVRTSRYFCTARLADSGDCDLFRVDARPNGTAAILRVRRRAGCVLPAG